MHDVKQVPVYASSKDLLGKYSGDNHLKNLTDCINITTLNTFRPLRVCELTLYNLKSQECKFTEAVLTWLKKNFYKCQIFLTYKELQFLQNLPIFGCQVFSGKFETKLYIVVL